MDYYINQDHANVGEKGIYLGNKDMITDEMVEQINKEDMENKYTSYDFVDISESTQYPTQQDNNNCGLYCMWYYVLHMFQDESKKLFDPALFR